MIQKQILVLLIILNSSLYLKAQDKEIKKANDLFNQYAFLEAKDSYLAIVKKGKASIEVYQKLGDCYYFNSDFKNANIWYRKMWAMHKKFTEERRDSIQLNLKSGEELQILPEYYFRTAQTYKFLKDYDKANQLMLLLKEKSNNDSRANRLIEQPDYLKDIALQSGRFTVKNISSNAEGIDFAPSLYKDQLVFSSTKPRGNFTKKNRWNQQGFLSLYISKDLNYLDSENVKLFSENISSRLHESTSIFTKDGKTIYFTRNNFINKKYSKDSTGINRLKIYVAKLNENSEWSSVSELPFNNDNYSVAHPALSVDQTKMFFASDMPGGYGMSDIYVVDINKDGTFGIPINLGPKVNTEGRDSFPFISASSKLYFASDGHLGLGGYDIFVTDLNDSENIVYNLGTPVNSYADDITFVIDQENNKGYFSSNRESGQGNDNIYAFVQNKPLVVNCTGVLQGVVIDQETKNSIENAKVLIKSDNNEIIFKGFTDSKGAFETSVSCEDKNYQLVIVKKDYQERIVSFFFSRNENKYEETIGLISNLPPKGTDLADMLKLKPIYFESNKASIPPVTAKKLDELTGYLNKHNTIKIKIESHTDSKGNDSYNLDLSKRRAQATYDYLIKNGIDKRRLTHQGFGEKALLNKCSNGVKCSKSEHAINRRSEFIIVDY